MPKYIIEVQKKCDDEDLFEHIGYINIKFNRISEAKKYVKTYNTNIKFTGRRRLSYYYSTVNILTNLRFIVRKYYKEKLSLQPF